MLAKRMLFIAEKESFITRVLVKKVQDAGVECVFIKDTVDDINSHWKDAPLLTLYMEEGTRPREDVLHFLLDNIEEKDAKLIIVGEQSDINYVCDHIPGQFIYASFPRPVDNTEFSSTLKDYYSKMESGDFKKSILIVDDDPQYLNIVRQWLMGSYKVSLASSGLQAIKFLGKNKVDLILLDHEMPVTSGPQVLEMLRSDSETSSIPVMFLTGKSDKESVMAVVALHPEGYFLKSIQKDDLLEELKKFFILQNAK
ncbi:MAG: response regulator [Lachnospiraceae bacterium]|nr:response regulator [Lachnospiraceae bacterium]